MKTGKKAGNICKACHNKEERKRYQEKKAKLTKQLVMRDEDAKKRCTVCKLDKKLSEYYEHSAKGTTRAECKECASKWRKSNYQAKRDIVIKQTSNYTTQRMKRDPAFKFERNQRARVWKAFKQAKIVKSERTMKYVGCRSTFLSDWLLFQLTGDMTLDNYGEYWHIDQLNLVQVMILLTRRKPRNVSIG